MDIHPGRRIHCRLGPYELLSYASDAMAARFLRPTEREYVASQVAKSGRERFEWREVRKALVAPHVWIISVVFFFLGAILFGLALYVFPLSCRSVQIF